MHVFTLIPIITINQSIITVNNNNTSNFKYDTHEINMELTVRCLKVPDTS